MEQDILNKLQAQEVLLQQVYESVEKTRKYFLWTLIGSIAMFVLPLLAIAVILPKLISTISAGYGI